MKILIILLLTFISSLALAGAYYNPSPQIGNYYSGGRYAPYNQAQIELQQSLITQRNINIARQRQLQLEQYEANYNRMRQYYADRRDTERFASFGNSTPSKASCEPKAVMSNEEISRCK
jgi:hypothetical protein